LAVKHGRPVLFWEALFRGQRAADETWAEVDRKLFEYLANNHTQDKWKRKTIAVNLSTESVLGMPEDFVQIAASNWNMCLQDVGKFKVNEKSEMQRRNPRTGEMFTSPAKKIVKITSAKVLRDAVNA